MNIRSAGTLSFVIVIAGALVVALLLNFSPGLFVKQETPPALVHLKTGGTSVVAMLLENRIRGVYRREKGVEVDYASTGSTEGVKGMIDGDYAIGFTHAALTDAQRQQAQTVRGKVLHIPIVVCAVVPIYNVAKLKDKPPLKFTGEVLADIFRGKINRWNDRALKQLNDGIELPDAPIQVVHREDSSGTTFIFTDYLSGASAVWREEIGPPSNKIKWPIGRGMARNLGVADHVYRTEGTIGYVDLLFANYGDFVNRNVQYGAVQNKDKTAFIRPTAENMTAALQAQLANLPEDLTFRLTNQSGENSYPICGCVWAVCYETQPASSQKLVVDFLHWMTHDGQRYATGMSYAPLPDDIVRRLDEKLVSIKALQ
jgi:phosphate transport system substrate-binding protein